MTAFDQPGRRDAGPVEVQLGWLDRLDTCFVSRCCCSHGRRDSPQPVQLSEVVTIRDREMAAGLDRMVATVRGASGGHERASAPCRVYLAR